MGNCVRSSRRRQYEEDEDDHHDMADEECRFEDGDDMKEGGGGVVKVKIMLTKEELEWLMFQLKGNSNNHEGKTLQDFLQEIERERSRMKAGAWKPSLESIKESPEGLDIERLLL